MGRENGVMVMQDVLLFNEATNTEAKRLSVRGYDTAEVEIYGSATAATVKFKGAKRTGIDRDRVGFNTATQKPETYGGMGQTWQLNIGGLDSLLLELSSVTGGNVSVNVRYF